MREFQSLLALGQLDFLSHLFALQSELSHLRGALFVPVWKPLHQSSQLSAILAELLWIQELRELWHLLLSQLLEQRLAL